MATTGRKKVKSVKDLLAAGLYESEDETTSTFSCYLNFNLTDNFRRRNSLSALYKIANSHHTWHPPKFHMHHLGRASLTRLKRTFFS